MLRVRLGTDESTKIEWAAGIIGWVVSLSWEGSTGEASSLSLRVADWIEVVG